MLSGMDFADRRALADRADELWTHTARQHHDVVAAIAEEEQAAHVAAVRGQSGQDGRANREPPPPSKKRSPADQKAMDDSGLCYYHFTYADEATKCRRPCAWLEN
jgi:hypothetical protein